jgi:arylsulfatase A-like enzyme
VSTRTRKSLRRARGIAAALVCSAASVVLAPACRKAEKPAFVRFVDILERDNIVDSPLLDLARNPVAFARTNPNVADMAGKNVLLDLGAGRNPLLVKKKVAMGPFQENGLLAPPRSLFRFQVRVPAGAALEFSYGIYWGNDKARRVKGSTGAEFIVRTRGGETEGVLFDRKVTLPAERILVYNHKTIDLSTLSGQTITLEFLTRGDQDTLAVWFNPVLFTPQAAPRDVILISLDTLRADHLGAYGYARPTSPNMDKLAAESVLFRNTYATSPWTLPSHVSILSGLDCLNHGVRSSANRMDPRDLTLADRLRRAGFETAAFTGGGFVSGLFGMNKGFETFRARARLSEAGQAGSLFRTIRPWIQENAGRSFFLFLHTYQIHNPYLSPEPFDTMFLDADATFRKLDMSPLGYNHENRYKPPESDAFRRNVIALYDEEIRYTDAALIAPLLAELKRLRLYDRTMIVITADHGEEFYEKKGWLHTHALYEPLLKVPLIIKYPGSRNAGKKVDRRARITDIMPTILEEMGVDFPRGELDGRSLVPLIRGAERGSERMFRADLAANVAKHRIPQKQAIGDGPYKIIVNDPYPPRDLAFFNFPPPDTGRLEVFDLASDPREMANLAATRPDLTRRLLKFLEDNFRPRTKVGKPAGPDADVGPDIQEELKALGYIR